MDFNDFPLDSVNWPVETVTKQLKQLNCPVQTVQTVGFQRFQRFQRISVQIRSNPLLFVTYSVTIPLLFQRFERNCQLKTVNWPVETVQFQLAIPLNPLN